MLKIKVRCPLFFRYFTACFRPNLRLFPYLEGYYVIIPLLGSVLSRWMLPFESQPYFSSTKTSLQGESLSEDKSSMSSPLPDLAPMPENDYKI